MTSFTRRDFIQRGLAAAAATTVLPFHLAPAAETTAAAPNERLSVAVIGVRGRGQAHARAFAARPDCEVTYICDADRMIGANFAKAFAKSQKREPKVVDDLRRVFEDKSVDVVSIATPNHWHALAAIWAMQAGKDVYLEKPVSHNISEGRRLIQVAEKYKRICQAGTQLRGLPGHQEAAKYVAAGKLGKATVAHCTMFRPREPIGSPGSYPVPKDVNYDLWAGPAPMAPVTRPEFHYDWHWFWDYGNGEIGNNSVHRVDTMRQILGLYGLGRAVLSYGGRLKFNDAGETPNTHVVVHDFGDLTVIQEVRNLKTQQPKFGADVYIQGTEGSMVVANAGVTVYDPKGKEVAKFTNADPPAAVALAQGKHRDDFGNLDDRHIANFIKAVRSRNPKDLRAEISEGHNSAALCHLGNISYRLGQPASLKEIREKLDGMNRHARVAETFESIVQHLGENGVDPEKERLTLGPRLEIDSAAEKFVGNPAADALLTRQYRKPFVVPGPEAI